MASPSLPVPILAHVPERGVWLLRTVLLAVVVLVALAVAIGGRPAPIDPPSGVSGVSDVSGVGLVGVQSGLVGVPQAGGTTR